MVMAIQPAPAGGLDSEDALARMPGSRHTILDWKGLKFDGTEARYCETLCPDRYSH